MLIAILQVDYDAICLALQATTIQVTKSSQLLSLTTHMTYHSWGSLAWAESVTKVEEKVTKAIKAALAGDKYDRPVLDAFNAVFEQSTLTPLKLKRFGSLKTLLLTEILPRRMAEAKKAAAPVIYDMLQKALMQLNYDTALGATFQLLDVGIRGCMVKHMIAHIKHRPLNLPESFQLAEDDKVKKKRSRLTDKLTQIVTATDKIAHIEEAISVDTDTDFGPSSSSAQEIPDFSELAQEEPDHEVVDDSPATVAAVATAATAAATMTDELQMHAVPQEAELVTAPHSCGAEATSASSHSTPVPLSVAVQVDSTAGGSSHSAASQGAPSQAASGRLHPDTILDSDMFAEAVYHDRVVICEDLPCATVEEDLCGFFQDCGKATRCYLGMLFCLLSSSHNFWLLAVPAFRS